MMTSIEIFSYFQFEARFSDVTDIFIIRNSFCP